MSRKVYWLRINGRHESLVTSWPQTSTAEVMIRGLDAGLVDNPEDDVLDPTDEESTCSRPRDKFPKGWVTIGVMGGRIRVKNTQTLEQACEPYRIRLEPEF
jgi:hypothetical protein